MLLKSNREKTILKQGLIIIGILAGVYLLVLSPFLKEGSSIMDEELERKTAEINRYIARAGALPSKEGFEKLEREEKVSEAKLRQLVDFVDPEKIRIPDTGTEAGLFFIERLHSSIKRISDQHDAAKVKLPENLGFGGGLPKEDIVGVLLRQLETVELVLDILLKRGDVEFYAIKPLKSIEYRNSVTKDILYSELPVQISIKTSADTLINLLIGLKNATPVVSVKELHIKSGQADVRDIEASFVLSTFSIVRSLE